MDWMYNLYLGHIQLRKRYTETGKTEPETACAVFWVKAMGLEDARKEGTKLVEQDYPSSKGWDLDNLDKIKVSIIPSHNNYTIVTPGFTRETAVGLVEAWFPEAKAAQALSPMWDARDGQFQRSIMEGEMAREFPDLKLKELGAKDLRQAKMWMKTALHNLLKPEATAA